MTRIPHCQSHSLVVRVACDVTVTSAEVLLPRSENIQVDNDVC